MAVAPGRVRDSVIEFLQPLYDGASLEAIEMAVREQVPDVAASSIRSYINLNVPNLFERVERGRYKLQGNGIELKSKVFKTAEVGLAELVTADCFAWLSSREPSSVHGVVTDPPYGLKEYSEAEQKKLRANKGGGIWRVPPSFDGNKRSPLPRFTILDQADLDSIGVFFKNFGALLLRVLVPGANVAIASNPLLAHIVSQSMASSGFEVRGSIVRLTMTMRGGDRPKNAHKEFEDVSVMPRSMWEPWVILRKPLEGRVQDNLRKWRTGGWRRPSSERPFGDVIKSSPTTAKERLIAPHPSLKPQSFLRQLVYSSLPLGEGVILDPFAGSGSTLAASNAIGYKSIGVEKDPLYSELARKSIPALAALKTVNPSVPQLFDSLPI